MSKRILIIDQESSPMENILRLKGFDVTLTENKETAIEMLEQEIFDIVILDISPNAEDFSVVRKIRKIQPMIPIIAVTGCERLEQCFKESDPFSRYSVTYLQKPFDIKELIRLLMSKMSMHSTH